MEKKIMRILSIFKIAVIGFIVIGLTGCIGNKNLSPKTVTFKGKSQKYSFIKKDPIDGKKITKIELQKILNNRVNELIDIKKKYVTVNNNSYSYDLGIKVTMACESKIFVDRKFNLVETDTNFIFTLYEPVSVLFSKEAYWANIGGRKVCMPGESEQYTLNIIKYFPSKIILETKKYEQKGEINTQYSDKSIYANFKRILGEYNWRYSSEQLDASKSKNVFNLRVNNKSFPLMIEVYPYRDGSKVIYSVTIKYNIDSSGKATLTQEDIEKIEVQIKDIINN
jgi:hypothetical protein